MKKTFFVLLIMFFGCKVFADDKMIFGLNVYNDKAQCGTCHTLKAAGSSGDIGPNLDELKASMERIIYTVTNGIGVMPAWEDILTKEEIDSVAYYVFNSTK